MRLGHRWCTWLSQKWKNRPETPFDENYRSLMCMIWKAVKLTPDPFHGQMCSRWSTWSQEVIKLTCDSFYENVTSQKLSQMWENHTCQPIQFTSIKSSLGGGYGHIGKCVQENTIFTRFCCCFKLSKKIEKLSNEQPTHAIAKCTLTGLVQ